MRGISQDNDRRFSILSRPKIIRSYKNRKLDYITRRVIVDKIISPGITLAQLLPNESLQDETQ